MRSPVSLRTKLVAAVMLPLALTLVAGVLAHVQQQGRLAEIETSLAHDTRMSELVTKCRDAFVRARRHERDFVVNVRSYGVEPARVRYVTPMLGELAATRNLLRQIDANDDQDPWREAESLKAGAALAAFETAFLDTVQLRARLGDSAAGIEADLRAEGRAIERLVDGGRTPQLLADLLAIRRYETDAIALRSDERRPLLHAAVERLARDADAALRGAAPTLQAHLRRYDDLFTQYADFAAAVDARMVDYLDAANTAESALDGLLVHESSEASATLKEVQEVRRSGRNLVLAISAASFLLGLLITWRVSRQLVQSLDAGVAFAQRIAGGSLDTRMAPQREAELAALADALNAMADATQRSSQREQEHSAALQRANRTLRTLSQCNYELVRCRSEADLLEAIANQIVEIGGYRLTWVGFAMNDDERTIRRVACTGPAAGYLDAFRVTWADHGHGNGPTGRALRSGLTTVVDDIRTAPEFAPYAERVAHYGLASCISLPLQCPDGTRGVLGIYSAEPNAFDAAEIRLLEELARNLAYGVGALREVAMRQRLEAQVDYQTNYDALTGLPNRQLFRERVVQQLHAADAHALSSAVMFIGIDRLRNVRDNLGDAACDQLVREIARRLVGVLRPGNAVGRISDEQFGVCIDAAETDADVAARARAIVASLSEPLPLGDVTYRPSISIGISRCPQDGDDADTQLRNAAAGLGCALTIGAGTVRFHAAAANEQAAERFGFESALSGALERDEFELYFQPKVSLLTGRVTGAEALLRWHHPTRGLVLPGQFIGIAEDSGQIDALGRWTVDTVCAHLAAWLRAGREPCPIAINLSPRQFRHEGLVASIANALQRHDVPAKLLQLEMTESAVMHDIESAIRILEDLQALGVTCSLDDFGTGHSSLSYMQRFPIHELKIDRSFVRDIASEPTSAAICKAVIGLARHLHLTVVAEGVETAAQANYLRRQGCDQIQGHLFSPALPAAQFEALLSRNDVLLLPGDAARERTLLVVDDEANIRASLRRLLRNEGYKVILAESAEQALGMLAEHDVQVILSDQRMPGMSGTEFLSRVSRLYPDIIRMVLSGYTDLDTVIESVNRGTVFRFLTKPWDDEQLRSHLHEAFRYHALARGAVKEAATR